MPVQLQCPHKGCMKIQEPWIEPKTDKIYCSLCNREVVNVNHFIKIQLKTLKQYRPKNTAPFAVKCNDCNKEDTPILENNEIVCSACLKPLKQLSPIFKNMLKEQLIKKRDIE